jgi:mannose-6-phosphate isomerase-like protein (cupin superfamily)
MRACDRGGAAHGCSSLRACWRPTTVEGSCLPADGAASRTGEPRVFKIMHLDQCPTSPMEPGRGEQIKLINSSLGTEKLDVHLNRLIPGGPRGKLHHHTQADNIYIVKRGEGTLTVEDKTYLIRENDVVYIPAGMKHSLANLSGEVFEIFEIYAPSGRHFDFVLDE